MYSHLVTRFAAALLPCVLNNSLRSLAPLMMPTASINFRTVVDQIMEGIDDFTYLNGIKLQN
jgi:hypothetical protein